MAEHELDPLLHRAPPPDDLGVQAFLDGFAEALTSGDGKAIGRMWETPAFVLGADLAHVVDAPQEAEQFFGGARAQYVEIGITDTRADIVRLDEITDHLVMVRVRWPYLDKEGHEMGAETSTYTLARHDGGDWKFRVVVVHGQEAVN